MSWTEAYTKSLDLLMYLGRRLGPSAVLLTAACAVLFLFVSHSLSELRQTVNEDRNYIRGELTDTIDRNTQAFSEFSMKATAIMEARAR